MIAVAFQWAGGILLGILALVFAVLLAAAVIAPMEQPTRGTVVVSIVIAFAIFLLMLACAVGAWGLLTAAIENRP